MNYHHWNLKCFVLGPLQLQPLELQQRPLLKIVNNSDVLADLTQKDPPGYLSPTNTDLLKDQVEKTV